jgi:hypothetical protein
MVRTVLSSLALGVSSVTTRSIILCSCAGVVAAMAGCAAPGDGILVDPFDGSIRWKDRSIRPGDYLLRREINGQCYLMDPEGKLCVPCRN